MPKERIMGKCMLTKEIGPMAKSHIIPLSFLQRATDAPFIEWRPGEKPRKSFAGWYDQGILNDNGEGIIAKLDDVAAKCFIENRFTYRGRRDEKNINFLNGNFVGNQVYEIKNIDSNKLHLFAISMLWRAAVSSNPAFEAVRLSGSHLEDIRKRILSGNPGDFTDYPTYFGVFCDHEELMKIAPFKPHNYPYYRFFMDGVVCYVSPTRRNKKSDLGLLLAGSEPDRIKVICFPSVGSNQAIITARGAHELFQNHGDVFAKFRKSFSRRR
ncbi:hypothetical protein [Azospirillum doebereinerae]